MSFFGRDSAAPGAGPSPEPTIERNSQGTAKVAAVLLSTLAAGPILTLGVGPLGELFSLFLGPDVGALMGLMVAALLIVLAYQVLRGELAVRLTRRELRRLQDTL